MKGCLKSPSLPGTPSADHDCDKRKCVAFCPAGSEEVFPADEWDRTPAEPAQRLSYQDILELKQIQQSLPTAPQKPDPLSSRPHAHYLKKVPLMLLPLVPETCSARSIDSFPAPAHNVPPPAPSHPSARPPPKPWQSPAPPLVNPRPRPHFAFLPLLDTPQPSFTPTAPAPPSPPSSPRTFAEFEASLDMGNDDVLHHMHIQQQPTVQSTDNKPLFNAFTLPSTPPPTRSNGDDSYFPKIPSEPNSKPKAAPAPSPLSPATAKPAPAQGLTSSSTAPAHAPAPDQARVDTEKRNDGSSPSTKSSGTNGVLPKAPPPQPTTTTTLRPGPRDKPTPAPYFSFERSSRALSPPPRTKSRELRSPSPILVPYCVSMARTRGSSCSSPVIVPLSG